MPRMLGMLRPVLAALIMTTLAVLPGAHAGPSPYPGASGKPFQALQSQIDAIQADMAGIEARIAALQADVEVLQGQIAQNTGDVAALQNQVISHTSSISALQALVTSLQGQIALLEQTKQNTITGSCIGGSAIRTILPTGSVVCEFDAGEARMAVFATEFSIEGGEHKFGTAVCPPGWFATGGGHATSISASNVAGIIQSEPVGTTSWTVGVVNPVGAATATARATVVCASN